MDNIYFARIKEIHFKNFRNIEEGSIDFPNSKFNEFLLEENPSILGLYGQNGSGKTSVIMAIELLKDVISGKQIDKKYLSCIKKGSDRFTLDFVFSMYSRAMDDNNTFVEGDELADCYDVYYSFDITKQSEFPDEDLLDEAKDKDNHEEKIRIENEIFSYRNMKLSGEIVSQKHIFLDTSSKSNGKNLFFGSERRFKEYFGQNNELVEQLKLNKYLAYESSKSFVFSVRVQNLISKGYTKKHNPKLAEEYERIMAFRKEQVEAAKNTDYEKRVIPPDEHEIEIIREYFEYSNGFVPLELIENLFLFGSSYLYVINTATTGLININSELPLLLWGNDDDGMPYRKVPINMDEPTKIPVEKFDSISKSLDCLNMVLEKMIPGMKLLIANQTVLLSEENAKEYSFEILSCREDTVIPLKYESDGVRRLVSILSLLIAAYNEASFTIAIDEIDSGIFEYLLGELLSVFSDSSKGQLIFTSHNLRPLEVLPSKFLCFTTSNPNNRFIKIPNRGNSNLRDGYFRSIILDTQKEQVYKPTNKYDIQTAFYKAGHGADQ